MRNVIKSVALALMAIPMACVQSPKSDARGTYNEGLKQLGASELDPALKSLVEARGEAGGDGELRFRSAMALGLAEARRAEQAEASDPSAALKALESAASWYSDAVRLREDSAEARQALQTVRWRAQVLADQINKSENGLEARIAKALESQRGIQAGVRQALSVFDAANPLPLASTFEQLAIMERTLYSETGTIMDLAADELALLQSKNEEELSDEERIRSYQLQSLDGYLNQARAFEDESRRELRRDRPGLAHDAATSAIASLTRAEEQLLDPAQVLGRVASDQAQLLQQTDALAQITSGTLLTEEGETPKAPAWLNPHHLGERQGDLGSRLGEVSERFQGALAARAAAQDSGDQVDPNLGPDVDPNVERALKAASLAMPHLDSAQSAMGSATESLGDEKTERAALSEGQALEELALALEFFAPLRQVIEMAYADQTQVNALMDPDAQSELKATERREAMKTSLERNDGRLQRLVDLLAQEKEKQLAQMQQGADPSGGGQAPDTSAVDAMFEQAEVHRAAALEATQKLAAALSANSPSQARQHAETAREEIEELRRIFFSIVEHLKDLLAKQTQTRDETARAHPLIGDERSAVLDPALDAQTEHVSLAQSLADALAKQADQASQSQDDKAAQAAESLVAAQGEVSQAAGEMTIAESLLKEAKGAAMSVDLEPALTGQDNAMGHLEEAIRLLQPPPDQQDQQDQDQNQEKSEEEKKQEQEEQQKQADRGNAKRRMQNIREREAERLKDKAKPRREPVEKDW